MGQVQSSVGWAETAAPNAVGDRRSARGAESGTCVRRVKTGLLLHLSSVTYHLRTPSIVEAEIRA